MTTRARMIAISAWLSAVPAADAAEPPDMLAYGFQIGAPLSLSECEHQLMAGKKFYALVRSACLQIGLFGTSTATPVFPDSPGVWIHFPIGNAPVHASGYAIKPLVLDGKLQLLSIPTQGLLAQTRVLADLITKYGQPTKQSRVALQNQRGASFDAIVATWDFSPALVVEFLGSAGRVDYGTVEIGTPGGFAELKRRVDKLSESSRPL